MSDIPQFKGDGAFVSLLEYIVDAKSERDTLESEDTVCFTVVWVLTLLSALWKRICPIETILGDRKGDLYAESEGETSITTSERSTIILEQKESIIDVKES